MLQATLEKWKEEGREEGLQKRRTEGCARDRPERLRPIEICTVPKLA